MSRVRVVVEASDPLTAAGAPDHLRPSPELQILPSSELKTADVLVMCVDYVDAKALAKLRDASAIQQLRTVLVTDHLRVEDVKAAAECRVGTVVARRQATPERLPHVIVDTHRSEIDGAGSVPGTAAARQALNIQQRRLLEQAEVVNASMATVELGPRELAVLRLLADGYGTSEIAERISYSERTVKNVLFTILTQLQARNRSHAVACALRAGLI